MTQQNSRELAEQRLAAEADRRRLSDEAKEIALAKARKDKQRAQQAKAEHAAALLPWKQEHDRLTALVRRAADQLLDAEAKSVANPLDVGLGTDALGAERCLVRLQLRLDEHSKTKPA